MNTATILTTLRYILVAVGGYFTAKFSLDAETVNTIVTAVLTLIPAVIGIITTVKNRTKVDAANTVLDQAKVDVSKTTIAKEAAKLQA